ncbi:MAG: hypothetical protein ABFS21_04250 [Actinomycetota bacterium]
MKGAGYIVSRWWWRRFHPVVRSGWMTTEAALRTRDYPKMGYGLALVGFGLLRGRKKARLIYRTSLDVGQGATVRVMQGRKPIGETSPIP